MKPFFVLPGPIVIQSWILFGLLAIWAASYWLSYVFKLLKVRPRELIPFLGPLIPVWFTGAFVGQDLTVGNAAWGTLVGGKLNFEGMVLYGGVFATLIGAVLLYPFQSWKDRVDLDTLFDAGLIALGFSISLGRVGCFLTGCCFGTPAGIWPGVIIPGVTHPGLQGVPLHPAPLYEGIVMGLAALFAANFLVQRLNARPQDPQVILPALSGWVVILVYAPFRFLLEFIRGDARGESWNGLSPSQWISVAILLFACVEVPRTVRKGRRARAQSGMR